MSDGEDGVTRDDLEWRDYVALAIALGQTVLLPFLLVLATLIVLFLLSLIIYTFVL